MRNSARGNGRNGFVLIDHTGLSQADDNEERDDGCGSKDGERSFHRNLQVLVTSPSL
jgi:hypothetical protein